MKILIVEDEKNISELLKLTLNKRNFEVFIVTNFSNVIEDFLSFEPHLVLLDVNLPYLDGFIWCQKIREYSSVPVIFLSSRDSMMDQVMAMNTGSDDYVTKPFSEDVLVAKINALLRRTYSYNENVRMIIEHNGVILNLRNTTLTYNDCEINLTKTEHKILTILMENKGNIVSRDKIITALWDDANFINDNTLTVNIRRIRIKLEECELFNYIETIKNGGYIIK